MKVISILGSTGSIGQSTLDVIRLHKDSFDIFALSCNSNIELLAKQTIEFNPRYIVCKSENDAKKLKKTLPNKIRSKVLFSDESNNFIATNSEVTHVVAAISGSAGLESTYHAAKAKKIILLANKESMVMAGPLIMDLIKNDGFIIPIDSEHNAIFQVLHGDSNKKKSLKKIILTASGGPFINMPIDHLENVSIEEALNHPNWKMGAKVSIDSATMMNKGLEVIEASYLFGLSESHIDVLIHPQSIIHSFAEFIDGSYLAQLGDPDMRIPISYALGFPHRICSGASSMNLIGKNLSFFKPDLKKFGCLSLSYNALREGHNFCVALNASNEIAVQAFLNKQIKFTDIYKLNFELINRISTLNLSSINEVFSYDAEIRNLSNELIKKIV